MSILEQIKTELPWLDDKVAFDLTRGKPSPDQLSMTEKTFSNLAMPFEMDGIDLRNYGTPEGIPSARELGSKILVLAVGMGEEAERIEKFQKKYQFEFQIFPDPEMTVTQLYGVRNIPITYLVDTSGIIVGRALGPREWTRPKLLKFFEDLASEQSRF